MKIHIIGGSGTGKSYIAEKLSEEFNIDHYDLDDIFLDNNSEYYGVKATVNERKEKLEEILKKESWIIEGVYYKWLKESFQDADYIFILSVPRFICVYRIVLRFLKRKFKRARVKKETFKSLITLIRWTSDYNKNTMPNIMEFLKPYKSKVIVIKNTKYIFNYISAKVAK